MNLGYEPEGLKIYLFGGKRRYEKTDERTDRTGGRDISYGSFRKGAFSLHEQKERQDQSTEMG